MAFLELRGVSKGFERGRRRLAVLEDLNLEVEEGEFVCIVGPSGAGKSTLVSLIAGLTRADAGTLTLGGEPIVAPGPDRGVVFPEPEKPTIDTNSPFSIVRSMPPSTGVRFPAGPNP